MRATSSSLLIALVAAGLIGLTVWLLGSTGGAERPVGFPDAATGVVSSSGEDVPSRVTTRARVELTVDVEPRAELLPPLDAGRAPCCRLFAGDLEVAAQVRILAGARAASAGARVGGWHLVEFDDGGGTFCRVVQLDPDQPVAVQVTRTSVLSGFVRATAGVGAPVAGATVWAGGRDPSGGLQCAVTDADGRFDLEGVRGGPGVPLTVWADGLASRYRLLDLSWPAVDPIDVALDPAARLDVVCTARLERPARGVVEIAPRGGDVGLLHYPFFLAALQGGRPLGPNGTAELVDLPAGAALDVWVVHPELVEARPVAVRARPDRRSRAVVDGATGPLLEGVVRDASGTPVAGAVVVATTSSAEVVRIGSLLPPAAHDPPGVRTTTDAGGAFRLARPGFRGSCRLEIRAPGWPGIAQQIAAGRGAIRHDFVLPTVGEFAAPFVLRVHLRADGREVHARRGGAGFVRRSDREPFEVRLGEPALVDVTVRVVIDGRSAAEQRFEALAVTGPVDLRIDA